MHATDTHRYHDCGGTILTAQHGGAEYIYCDRCGAFTYDTHDAVPTGADFAANQAAWDEGVDCSPDAQEDAS